MLYVPRSFGCHICNDTEACPKHGKKTGRKVSTVIVVLIVEEHSGRVCSEARNLCAIITELVNLFVVGYMRVI